MEFADDVMTINEVALFLKVKPVTIYKLVNQKRIPGVKISGTWRFKRNLICEWISYDSVYNAEKKEIAGVT